MKVLEKVKLLLAIEDDSKDALLNLLINNAIEYATTYTHNSNIEDLHACIARMVCYDYSRLGTEGVSSENYSGVSFSYTADYPEQVLKMLKKYRKVVTL